MHTYKIQKIQTSDFDQLMSLYISCFKNDSYIKAMFPGDTTRVNKMKREFEGNIKYCIENDGAYGIFENDELIAFILFFDYKKIKQTDYDKFEKIFKGENKTFPLLYEEEIHTKIDNIDGSVIYLLSMGVSEKYRNKGIASSLIDFMQERFPNDYLVGDVSNPSSMKIYEERKNKRNFETEKIDEDYYFVKYQPNSASEDD